MNRWVRMAIATCLLGVAACATTTEDAAPMVPQHHACRVPGNRCRWDDQCCSGRCYVDLGCSG